MENQTEQNLGGGFNAQISIPNSVAVLVLGIVSIALCCTNIIGVACGIIALVLAGKAKTLYEENPDAYTLQSFNNLKAGRICAIIGTILSGLYLIYIIVVWAFIGTMGSMMPWDQFNNF